MSRRLAVSVVAAGVLAASGLGFLLAGPGSGARRPAGAAERFLQAVSTDNDTNVNRWGRQHLADRLRAFDTDDDTHFATIELGRAATRGNTATVPARVVRNDTDSTVLELALTAKRRPNSHDWRIIDAVPVARAAVPSRGAPRPARAPVGLWLVLAPIAVGLAVGADALVTRLRATPCRRP